MGIALCPKKMTTLDHRIFWSQPLRIVLPKTSPAHAALEDLKEDLFYSPPQSQNQKQVIKQLAAGEFNAHALLKYRSVVDTKSKIPRQVRLATLTVREFKAKPVYVAQNTPTTTVQQEAYSSVSSETVSRINGRVELKDGLALWDPNMQLKIKQIVDGQTVAETQAGMQDGSFVLPTETQQGTLIAELVNAQNQVYGVGTVSIPQGKNTAVVSVSPSQQGFQAKVVSGSSHGGESFAVDRGSVSILGSPIAMRAEHKVSYNEPMIENGSNVLMQASGEKHSATLAMGLAGVPMDVAVMSKSMSRAMLNLSLDEQDRYGADDLGMVWGKVTRGGVPVKGARVQISDGVQAVYFNELFLPDRKLEGTTENGVFAFVKLNSGIKSIRVFKNDQVVAAEIMPVDIGHVSQLNFELQDEKTIRFIPQAYGVREKPQVLYAQVLGLEEEKDVSAEMTSWNLPRSNHPLWFEFSAGPEYERTRQLVLPNQENLDVPTFKRSWVDQVLKENGIQRVAYSSTIIGFGPSANYKVESAGGQVIYLDRNHKAVPYGVAAGCFIIANLKSDLQVVNVVDQQTGLRWIQTIVAEPDVTSVLIHPRAE